MYLKSYQKKGYLIFKEHFDKYSFSNFYLRMKSLLTSKNKMNSIELISLFKWSKSSKIK